MRVKLKSPLTKKQREILKSVIRSPFNQDEKDRCKRINSHSEEFPHWSFNLNSGWRSDRWDPLSNAPHSSSVFVRIRDQFGVVFEHAQFDGHYETGFHKGRARWITSEGNEIKHPVEWQPEINKEITT